MDLVPTNAQYCFGLCRPRQRSTKGRRRSPSPPARTIDQRPSCFSTLFTYAPLLGCRQFSKTNAAYSTYAPNTLQRLFFASVKLQDRVQASHFHVHADLF